MLALWQLALTNATAGTVVALGALLSTTACHRAPDLPSPLPSCASAREPLELTLERALPIDAAGDFQPSGLLLWQGRLLTVSDKHDRAVFEITFGGDTARALPLISFEPPATGDRKLDWEALAWASDGSFLLASESQYRVLAVAPSGQASWRTGSLEDAGRRASLFSTPNAGLEGLVTLADGELLVASERQPRGLLRMAGTTPPALTGIWVMQQTTCRPLPGRSVDFSDLATFGGHVYALERHAHRVAQLQPGENGYVARAVWSFGASENDPRFAYQDRRFGLAEGLAIDRDHVFVVLDNNGDHRAANTTDRRPLLFIFRRPAG